MSSQTTIDELKRKMARNADRENNAPMFSRRARPIGKMETDREYTTGENDPLLKALQRNHPEALRTKKPALG